MSKKKNFKILMCGVMLTYAFFSINVKAMENTNENKIEKLIKTNNELLNSLKNSSKQELINLNLKNDRDKIIEYKKNANVEQKYNKSKSMDYYFKKNIRTKNQNENMNDSQNAKIKLEKMANFVNNFDRTYSNSINTKTNNYNIKPNAEKYPDEKYKKINNNINNKSLTNLENKIIECKKNINTLKKESMSNLDEYKKPIENNKKQKIYINHLPKIHIELHLNTLLVNLENSLKELDNLKKEQTKNKENKIIEYKADINTLINQSIDILDEYKEKYKEPIANDSVIRERLKVIDNEIKNDKETKKFSKHIPKAFKELNLNYLLNILEDNIEGLDNLKEESPKILENKFMAYKKNINNLTNQLMDILDEYKKNGNQIENENAIKEKLKFTQIRIDQKFKKITLLNETNKILKELDRFQFSKNDYLERAKTYFKDIYEKLNNPDICGEIIKHHENVIKNYKPKLVELKIQDRLAHIGRHRSRLQFRKNKLNELKQQQTLDKTTKIHCLYCEYMFLYAIGSELHNIYKLKNKKEKKIDKKFDYLLRLNHALEFLKSRKPLNKSCCDSEILSEILSEISSEISSKISSKILSYIPSKIPSKILSAISSKIPSKIPSKISSEIPDEIIYEKLLNKYEKTANKIEAELTNEI